MADRLTQKDIELSEMGLKDFVESGAFEPGSRAYEKTMQDDVDQAVERNKTIKGAKQALRRIKAKELIKNMPSQLRGTSYERSLMGDAEISAGLSASSMKHGGSVMSRGCKMGRNKPTKLY